MKKKHLAIIFVIISTFFTAIGQLMYKIGVNNFSLERIIFASLVIIAIGMVSYIIGVVLLLFAFKREKLSLLYPFYALSFVWVALLSIFVLSETMTLLNWLGIATIVGGVTLVTREKK
jgi:drug/metabolite transporter (DMT)-like permease